MAPSQSPTIPLVALMSQVEQELQTFITNDLQVRGGMIVSSIDNVVRIDHRLPVDSLPGTIQNLYWDGKRRPEILHSFADIRQKLREGCGM